jgi:hypothetical protein
MNGMGTMNEALPQSTFQRGAFHELESNSRGLVWTGRVLSGIVVLFLAVDIAMKILQPPVVLENSANVGFGSGTILGLGILQCILLALYLVPRTAILGAVLWTGYLGGAVATHVRLHDPWLSHTLFPVYVGVFLWAGLWPRDRRARLLISSSATSLKETNHA